MLGINGDYSVVHIKDKIWRFLVNSRKKSALKLFIEKLFYLISWICLQHLTRIVWRNRFLFLARSRCPDFAFSEDFSNWKVWLVLQNNISGNSAIKNTWIWYLSKNTILHFSVNYEFGTKRCSSCSRPVFMKKCFLF